jgi:endonuclease III
MIAPLSVLAQAVVTFIIPKALERVGEMIGESAFLKSKETIQATRDVVQNKLKSTNTDGILTIAEADPSETNIQMLETVLISQMKTDEAFASQIKTLLQEIKKQSPSAQVVLDSARIKGSVEVGNVNQSGSQGSGEQAAGLIHCDEIKITL